MGQRGRGLCISIGTHRLWHSTEIKIDLSEFCWSTPVGDLRFYRLLSSVKTSTLYVLASVATPPPLCNARQDMVWLCALDPPISGMHVGRRLLHLLKRVKTWLSEVVRWEEERSTGNLATNSTSNRGSSSSNNSWADLNNDRCDTSSTTMKDTMWVDFKARTEGLCRLLTHLLDKKGARR